jgi:5-methyltetrahydrofolate--homocysteine methyltransferase
METIFDKIKSAIKDGDDEGTKQLVAEALSNKLEPRAILEEAMMPAMQEIGELFSKNEVFIPEMLVAAEAMNAGVDMIKARIGSEIRHKGMVMLGTVEGDIHTIGKNLVKICLESAGYEVMDLGENIKAAAFAEAYVQKKPKVLGLSALLSSTALSMRDVIQEVRKADPSAKIIIGGAPITQAFADKISASGYAPNAFDATKLVDNLLK